jgi:hypothetical protein
MMALDALNTLDKWPLPGLDKFIEECKEKDVKEVYLTGTNTDPLLYKHHNHLIKVLRNNGFSPGIRTNGVWWQFA